MTKLYRIVATVMVQAENDDDARGLVSALIGVLMDGEPAGSNAEVRSFTVDLAQQIEG